MRYEIIKPEPPELEIVLHMSPAELGFFVGLLARGTLYENCTEVSKILNSAYREAVR